MREYLQKEFFMVQDLMGLLPTSSDAFSHAQQAMNEIENAIADAEEKQRLEESQWTPEFLLQPNF